jgi:outer membrane lipoprotein
MNIFPFSLLFILLLGGCASNIPIEIREPPMWSPLLSQAQANPKAYQGQPVRWGGNIVSAENKPNDTWIEVLAKELGSEGRPVAGDESVGRFVVRVSGFLDPAVYRKDRQVTVYGKLEGLETRKIGDLPYAYPLIKAEKIYLWPEYSRDRYPYYYYPYGYPPYYYYPYPRFNFGFYRYF